jgi:uncharacterized protein YjbI with pentapeptide repeats
MPKKVRKLNLARGPQRSHRKRSRSLSAIAAEAVSQSMKSLFRFSDPVKDPELAPADEPEKFVSSNPVFAPDEVLGKQSSPPEADGEDAAAAAPEEKVPLDEAEQEVNAAGAPLSFLCRKFGNLEFEDVLEQHRRWIESDGRSGTRADLAGANFKDADMIGAELAGANLFRANFRGADLLMANFRGACLVEADLRDANLVGANFREASLAGAKLDTASGLLAPQLAGANLLGAVMPDTISLADELGQIGQVSGRVRKLLATVALACAAAAVIIVRTSDVQLLSNSPLLPTPGLGSLMPILAFYLVGPIFLVGLYIGIHLALQRMWDVLAQVPAVFPDGKKLDVYVPRFVMALARSRLNWSALERSPTLFLESLLSAILAYWLIPISLVIFWARYLTEQDLRGTLLQIAMLMIVAMMARVLQAPDDSWLGARQKSGLLRRILRNIRNASPAALTILCAVTLLLLSIGTIRGMPRESGPLGVSAANGFRSWAADAFWLIGYDPFANISEAALSRAPADWSGNAEELKKVTGARLEDDSLRYAQAYGTFLVNARMRGSDWRGATLSQADLRGANLREANLRSAMLDRAQLEHSNLTLADLDSANLARANLSDADLTSASLPNSVLVDAQMNGAVLYGTNLNHALMVRALLTKADLRGAIMADANLSRADLRSAYMSSAKLGGARMENAQLGGAFLDDADLHDADLAGAIFSGAILSDTVLRGANLSGADFRGALQVKAAQICSAADRHNLLLDDALQVQVVALCGSGQ